MAPTPLSLIPHPSARNTARTISTVEAGSVLLSEHALCFVLLPSEKGRRCDACCRLTVGGRILRKCMGCAEFWYCGEGCQKEHWGAGHKALCSELARYVASNAYSALDERERLDALLLSSLIALITISGRISDIARLLAKNGGDVRSGATSESADPLTVFTELLPFSDNLSQMAVPPICPISVKIRRKHVVPPEPIIAALYSRFSNNNFVIHAPSLDAIAHAIFPRSSRVFNHSCSPNAWAAYRFKEGETPSVTVRAGRVLNEGREVTIPYLDPALPFKRRQEVCRYSYGFTCTCTICSLSEKLEAEGSVSVPAPPQDVSERSRLDTELYYFAFPTASRNVSLSALVFPFRPEWETDPDRTSLLSTLPAPLRSILHESYLPSLSSAFRTAAHDGPTEEALRTGRTLQALYTVVYPSMYPQTALHCLELCKVVWNTTIQLPPDESDNSIIVSALKAEAEHYLGLSKRALSLSGYFGDPDELSDEGPSVEIEVLERLLNEDGRV